VGEHRLGWSFGAAEGINVEINGGEAEKEKPGGRAERLTKE